MSVPKIVYIELPMGKEGLHQLENANTNTIFHKFEDYQSSYTGCVENGWQD